MAATCYNMKESNGYRNTKRPICVTFGSPLVGDEALQRAICERPIWKSSLLNVVAKKDPLASFFSSYTPYKPFGTFLFHTESGGNSAFEDEETILAVLDAMGSTNAVNLNMPGSENNMEAIRRKVLYRGVSELGELDLNSLRAGIRLQLKEVAVLDNISEDLIVRMEEKQTRILMRSKKNMYESTKNLYDMKINLVYMEWFMKTSRSKGGYYDRFKNPKTINEISGIGNHKHRLNRYWNNVIEEKLMSQPEGVNMPKDWLYGGAYYKRIVEPLDIAMYYQDYKDYEGYTNYLENRPDHYKLLEKWLDEVDEKDLNRSIKTKNKAVTLTEDSCFWAHVEEALISLRGLSSGGSSNDVANFMHRLEGFEAYMMRAITNFSVSPDIFLEGSSFMKWWNEYNEYKGSLYVSELSLYMNNGTYRLYQ